MHVLRGLVVAVVAVQWITPRGIDMRKHELPVVGAQMPGQRDCVMASELPIHPDQSVAEHDVSPFARSSEARPS